MIIETNIKIWMWSNLDKYVETPAIELCDGNVIGWSPEGSKTVDCLRFLLEGTDFYWNLEDATEEENLCQHECGNASEEEHTCPFREDIHNDSETLCNCCDDCSYECARDI